MNTLLGINLLILGMVVLLIAVFVLIARVSKLAKGMTPSEPVDSSAEPAVEPGIPGEVVAAIAAAVAVCAGQPGKSYAVRSIRRAPEQSAWARAGRMEQLNNRI